jgi:hypothetical protein
LQVPPRSSDLHRLLLSGLLVLAGSCTDASAPPAPPPPQFVLRVSADSNPCLVEVSLVALYGPGIAATHVEVALGATAEDTLQPGPAGPYWHETRVFVGSAMRLMLDTAAVPGASLVRC